MTPLFKNMVNDLVKPANLILASLTASFCNFLHMIIGIVGEAAEFREAANHNDRSNMVEELGDLEFYLEGLYQEIGTDQPTFANSELGEFRNVDEFADALQISSGNLLDKIKRLTIYLKPITLNDIEEVAQEVRRCLDAFYLYNVYSITRGECIDHNINKLLKGGKARYKEGKYSDAQANARADKVVDTGEITTAVIGDGSITDESHVTATDGGLR